MRWLRGRQVTGFQDAAPGLVIYGVLVLGHLWRAAQAFREARQLADLAAMLAEEQDNG